MAPRETENNAYAKFGVTNKEHYGMLWYFLEWTIHRTSKHRLRAVSLFLQIYRKKRDCSQSKQTSTAKLSSLRLKYHTLGLLSLTQTFSNVNDSQTNLYWIETHFKPTETFRNTHFSGCQGEALRLLRTNSSENEFKSKISHFRASLIERGYPESLITTTLSDIKFENRKQALLQKCKDKRILSFVTQYRPTVPHLKQILMQKWYLSKQQRNISRSRDRFVRKGACPESLKDILVRAKLWIFLLQDQLVRAFR